MMESFQSVSPNEISLLNTRQRSKHQWGINSWIFHKHLKTKILQSLSSSSSPSCFLLTSAPLALLLNSERSNPTHPKSSNESSGTDLLRTCLIYSCHFLYLVNNGRWINGTQDISLNNSPWRVKQNIELNTMFQIFFYDPNWLKMFSFKTWLSEYKSRSWLW